MNDIKEALNIVWRIIFGHNTVDSAREWKEAHDKARASRAEVEKIIKESEESQ